jgi:Secretion system C-terminal sorting domain
MILLFNCRKICNQIIILMLTTLSFQSYAQPGCTDLQAINYVANATVNDGSCLYANTTLPLTPLTALQAPLLNECSGIVSYDGRLWVHNDNTDINLYSIDSVTNTIFDTISMTNTNNQDWEDITTGDSFVYVGNFGNNFGNRVNLHILRLPLTTLDSSNIGNIDSISFSYPDQISFTSALNNTPFDCEAFFFYNDSLHLFTKDWVTLWTKHYKVPAIPGIYIADLVDSFNVNGLITSAAIQQDSLIILLGYNLSGTGTSFCWMLNDFQQSSFFSGNKRKFSLGSLLSTGQVEGITFNGNNKGLITNERTFSIVPAQLKSFDLSPYLTTPSSIKSNIEANMVFPGQVTESLQFNMPNETGTQLISIINAAGKIVYSNTSASAVNINTSHFSEGIYHCNIINANKKAINFSFVKVR